MNRVVMKTSTAAALVLLAASTGYAATIIDNSGCGTPGYKTQLVGGVFSTGGPQASFNNFANIPGLPGDACGFVDIEGVTLTGSASLIGTGIWGQGTTGGFIKTYDSMMNLQVELDFGAGFLSEASPAGTAAQLTTTLAAILGPYKGLFAPNTGTESTSVVGLTNPGMTANQLNGFTNASGNTVQGAGVVATPEPGTYFSLGGGLLALGLGKKWRTIGRMLASVRIPGIRARTPQTLNATA